MESVKCVKRACAGKKGVGHRKVAQVVGQGDNWFGHSRSRDRVRNSGQEKMGVSDDARRTAGVCTVLYSLLGPGLGGYLFSRLG